MRKCIVIDEEVYNTLKNASKKSSVPIKKLTELIITMNINFLNDPVQIAQKMDMINKKN